MLISFPRISSFLAVGLMLAVGATIGLNVPTASAATITWTGEAGDGKWETAGNWDLNRTPQNDDDVFILLDGDYTVSCSSAVTAKSVMVGGDAGAQYLSMRGSITAESIDILAHGGILLTNSSLSVSQSLTNSGYLYMKESVITGAVTNHGSIYVDAGYYTYWSSISNPVDGFLNSADGVIRIVSRNNERARLYCNDLTNEGTIELDAYDTGWDVILGTTGKLLNRNLITLKGSTTLSLSGQLQNEGTIDVAQKSSFTCLEGSLNTGLIDVHGGDIATHGPFTNTGEFRLGENRTWDLYGSCVNKGDFALGANRTLYIRQGGSFEQVSGPLAMDGQLILYISTYKSDHLLTNNNYIYMFQSNAQTPLTNNGRIYVDAGEYIYATYVNNPVGGFINAADGLIQIISRDNNRARLYCTDLINEGTVELDAYNTGWDVTLVTTGKLLNRNLIALKGPTTLSLSGQLQNEGTIDVAQKSSFTCLEGSLNTGLIDVHGGDIATHGPFTNEGEFRLGENRTWNLYGSCVNKGDFALGADRVLYVRQGANFEQMSGPLAVDGQLILYISNYKSDHLLTNNNYIYMFQSNAQTPLTNNGQISVDAGEYIYATYVNNPAGGFLNASDGTLLIASRNNGRARLYCTDLINEGKVELDAYNTGWDAILGASGKLINRNLITLKGSTTLSLSGQLQNEGTIDVGQKTIGNFAADSINTGNGLIDIHGGDLITSGALQNAATVMVRNARSFDFGNTAYTQTNGKTVLDGATLRTGGVDLQGGWLSGNGTVFGSVTNGGTVAPGLSAGRLDIVGNYVQRPTGTLAIELAGESLEQFDRVIVTGKATLDGVLDPSPIDGFVPEGGDRFRLLEAAQRVGEFAIINPNCKLGPVRMEYEGTSATLVIIASSRGDLNCDCSIDFNDIDPFVAALISREYYEAEYPGCDFNRGDINCDTSVDFDDIDGFVTCIINGECDPCP